MPTREDAEDATMEIFLKVREKLGQYDPSRPFGAWLYRVAANHCLDLLRWLLDAEVTRVSAVSGRGVLEQRGGIGQRAFAQALLVEVDKGKGCTGCLLLADMNQRSRR